MNLVASYGEFVGSVRSALLFIGVIVAVICAFDWAVRARKINPFNKAARFFRGRVDPLMAPVERVILRAGGSPASAPWWALVAYAVAAILLISLLQFIGSIILQVTFAAQDPTPRSFIMLLVSWAFSVLRLALLVRVLSTWFPVSPNSKWIRWSYVLTDWFIIPLGRIIPRIGMIDITPIVAWILLNLIQGALGIP